MTTVLLLDEIHKDFDDDLERILQSLADENGICRTCGQDHSLKITLDGVNTTINQIYKLFENENLEEAV